MPLILTHVIDEYPRESVTQSFLGNERLFPECHYNLLNTDHCCNFYRYVNKLAGRDYQIKCK